jgi:4-alpha-glucanotransferase
VKKVRFVLALHDHQPVGNFDDVFREATEKSYAPFLDVLESFAEIPVSLHVSGPLLEWMEASAPKVIERILAGVKRGQIAPIGGGFYEPILALLPERDRRGQLEAMTAWWRRRCDVSPRGVWTTERIWEAELVRSCADGGAAYTLLDDSIFRAAGVESDALDGYYVSEDQGRTLALFPISEALRYRIPFREPEAVIEHLASRAREESEASPVVVYGDDGEKFGSWPKTHALCYGERWLARFFEALRREREWLRTTTFEETLEHVAPAGKIFLPDASYREMTEWAMPASAIEAYDGLVHDLEKAGLLERARPFLRGGFYRNFRTKYVEADRMYGKMMEVSAKVERAAATSKASAIEQARRALYRGQCNCAYWHGVFGGLYLPHLRAAVYGNLVEAELLAESAEARRDAPLVETSDFDLDGRAEARLANSSLAAYVKPARGGHAWEIDLRPQRFNLLATLGRRHEAYHRNVARAITEAEAPTGAASIHDVVLTKERGLERILVVDDLPRESFVDRLFEREPSAEDLCFGRATEIGALSRIDYAVAAARGAAVRLEASAEIAGATLRLTKTYTIAKSEARLEVAYAIEHAGGAPLEGTFTVGCDFALLTGTAEDRFYLAPGGRKLGPLASTGRLAGGSALSLVDDWQKIECRLSADRDATFLHYPVHTVSQSEAGFEKIFQSACVVAALPAKLAAGGTWKLSLALAILPR